MSQIRPLPKPAARCNFTAIECINLRGVSYNDTVCGAGLPAGNDLEP